jgi:RNA polymerase sigma-70 factor (ECF subfamily)
MQLIEAAIIRVHTFMLFSLGLGLWAVGAALTMDADLPARLSRGESSALKELFDNHAGQLLTLAQRILKDRGEAEDVVQETFLEVWRRARQYDASRGQISTWMFVIARSRAIDRVRKRRSVSADLEQVVDSFAVDAYSHVQHKESSARVLSALELLPGEQRNVIELAFFEGLTQQQISERTGLPLGTIKTRMRLAMEKLARALSATPSISSAEKQP